MCNLTYLLRPEPFDKSRIFLSFFFDMVNIGIAIKLARIQIENMKF